MTSSSRQSELPFGGGEPANPPEAGDGPLVSLLSLKLLLLAFFILLNAMSELIPADELTRLPSEPKTN